MEGSFRTEEMSIKGDPSWIVQLSREIRCDRGNLFPYFLFLEGHSIKKPGIEMPGCKWKVLSGPKNCRSRETYFGLNNGDLTLGLGICLLRTSLSWRDIPFKARHFNAGEDVCAQRKCIFCVNGNFVKKIFS